MKATISRDDVHRIVYSDSHDPFHILGAHPITKEGSPAVAVRAFLPGAESLAVIEAGKKPKSWEAAKVHDEGFFEAIIAERGEIFPYRLKVRWPGGVEEILADPYSFLPLLSDQDLYLFNEGNQLRLFDKFGAHRRTVDGVDGVHFAVWAPNARRVSVVGEFNDWDGRRHQMRVLGSSGVWEIFIPAVSTGALYKFEVKAQNGDVFLKTDPFAFRTELVPSTASIIEDLDTYQWQDGDWIAQRAATDYHSRPVSVYEVHLGSWKRNPDRGNDFLTYRELAHDLVPYVKDMGFTHIELLPIAEHPYGGSWGYQVTGYYAPTSRYGTPEDFKYFVDQCHRSGIGVIIDWVPAHFPKDAHGLAWFDGTCLYEHSDPRQGEHRDWGTLVFNFGRNEVKNFLLANAVFWFEEYHADGLRIDAVASMLYLDYSRRVGEWVPNKYGGRENLDAIDFLRKLNEVVHGAYPGAMMIAEESTAWPQVSAPTYLGGLGFGFKWNMGWMHDMLEYTSNDPIHRKYHQDKLTFALLYAFHENFMLPLSHDEVVYGKRSLLGKMPGDNWQKFANLKLLFGFMYGHPGKKLLFMGGEFGQWNEWIHYQSLDWHLLDHEPHRKMQGFMRDLLTMYQNEPSLYEVDYQHCGFQWIDFRDSENSVISFVRRAKNPDDFLLFVFSFTPVPRQNYRVGCPRGGFYREALNSDSELYGGSNVGNNGGVQADDYAVQGQPNSLSLTLPPLGMLILKPI